MAIHEWQKNRQCKPTISNRRCYVSYKSATSSEAPITTGVPQGSILGPILFLIYINDLPKCVNNFTSTLYADDTTLCSSDYNYSTLISQSNSDLENLENWMKTNRLTLNISKTEMLLFTNRKFDHLQHRVILGGNSLNYTLNCKFLGVLIDSRLTFSDHIKSISNKISKNCGILYKIRDKLPDQTKLDFYYAFIYPYLTYNVIVWGGTYPQHLQPLIIQHKRVIRTLCHSKARDPTTPLFLRLGLLKFHEIYKLNLMTHMHKCMARGQYKVRHDVDTRSRNLAAPAYHRLTGSQHSVSYSGPVLWNLLPTYLREIKALGQFKRALKAFFIEQYSMDMQV